MRGKTKQLYIELELDGYYGRKAPMSREGQAINHACMLISDNHPHPHLHLNVKEDRPNRSDDAYGQKRGCYIDDAARWSNRLRSRPYSSNSSSPAA